MCEPRSTPAVSYYVGTAVVSSVLGSAAVRAILGAAVLAAGAYAAFMVVGAAVMFAAPVIALALPIGLAINANRSHRVPATAPAKTRQAQALEPRRRVDAAPRRLELETARPSLDGVVLERARMPR